MIIPEKHRILIVPDFGTSAEIGNILDIKEAIEAKGVATVIVADLRQMVLDEHCGEELQEAKVIELAARKLEALTVDRGLNWGPSVDDSPGDPVHEFGLENELESKHDDGHDETVKVSEIPRTVIRKFGNGRTLTIHVSRTTDDVIGAPHTIVVFGRSAMVAGEPMCCSSIRSMTRNGPGKSNIMPDAKPPRNMMPPRFFHTNTLRPPTALEPLASDITPSQAVTAYSLTMRHTAGTPATASLRRA